MAKKDSSITVFEDPKKSKTNEPNASEAAKKNVEQKLGEILPNVLTQLLNSNEIKQEPFEVFFNPYFYSFFPLFYIVFSNKCNFFKFI